MLVTRLVGRLFLRLVFQQNTVVFEVTLYSQIGKIPTFRLKKNRVNLYIRLTYTPEKEENPLQRKEICNFYLSAFWPNGKAGLDFGLDSGLTLIDL